MYLTEALLNSVRCPRLYFKGVGEMTKYTARDVAEFFLRQADPMVRDIMSNMKLQKLVYYAQGFYLAAFDKPLFEDKIEARDHGPVVTSLYPVYKTAKSGHINPSADYQLPEFDENASSILGYVYQLLGKCSAFELRKMSHQGTPWQNAYNKGNRTAIPHQNMREYFRELILSSPNIPPGALEVVGHLNEDGIYVIPRDEDCNTNWSEYAAV